MPLLPRCLDDVNVLFSNPFNEHHNYAGFIPELEPDSESDNESGYFSRGLFFPNSRADADVKSIGIAGCNPIADAYEQQHPVRHAEPHLFTDGVVESGGIP